jgi:hypothetical protein
MFEILLPDERKALARFLELLLSAPDRSRLGDSDGVRLQARDEKRFCLDHERKKKKK